MRSPRPIVLILLLICLSLLFECSAASAAPIVLTPSPNPSATPAPAPVDVPGVLITPPRVMSAVAGSGLPMMLLSGSPQAIAWCNAVNAVKVKVKMKGVAMDVQGDHNVRVDCCLYSTVNIAKTDWLYVGYRRSAWYVDDGSIVYFADGKIHSFWYWGAVLNGVETDIVIDGTPFVAGDFHYCRIECPIPGHFEVYFDGDDQGGIVEFEDISYLKCYEIEADSTSQAQTLGASDDKSYWQLMDRYISGAWQGQWPSSTSVYNNPRGYAGWTHAYDNSWGYINAD